VGTSREITLWDLKGKKKNIFLEVWSPKLIFYFYFSFYFLSPIFRFVIVYPPKQSKMNSKINFGILTSDGKCNVGLIACNSHRDLAMYISDRLGIKILNDPTTYFANTETRLNIRDSCRKKDIFIVGTGVATDDKSVNDSLMEILFMIMTCKRGGAKSVNILMPHYPYARQDKKDKPRAGISASDVATLITAAGANSIVCMDLHNPCIQGFFPFPCDNLLPKIILKKYLHQMLFDKDPKYRENYVVIAPDEGGLKRSSKFAEIFQLPLVTMAKQRNYAEMNSVAAISIQGGLEYVKGRTPLIFDDMCDTAGTVEAAIKVLSDHGAQPSLIVVTHGLLSGPGFKRIRENSQIKGLICSDSIPQNARALLCDKMLIFPIGELFSEVVARYVTGTSISELFE
jgi:ribose-phosphate pyrophosphokinase